MQTIYGAWHELQTLFCSNPQNKLDEFCKFFQTEFMWPNTMQPVEIRFLLLSANDSVRNQANLKKRLSTYYEQAEIAHILANLQKICDFVAYFATHPDELDPTRLDEEMIELLCLVPGLQKETITRLAEQLLQRIELKPEEHLHSGFITELVMDNTKVHLYEDKLLHLLKRTHPRDLLSPITRRDCTPIFPALQRRGTTESQFHGYLQEIFRGKKVALSELSTEQLGKFTFSSKIDHTVYMENLLKKISQ